MAGKAVVMVFPGPLLGVVPDFCAFVVTPAPAGGSP
jgi:hypothetical protein